MIIKKKTPTELPSKSIVPVKESCRQGTELKASIQESVSVKLKKQGAYACYGIEVSCTKFVDSDDMGVTIDSMIEMLHLKLVAYSELPEILALEAPQYTESIPPEPIVEVIPKESKKVAKPKKDVAPEPEEEQEPDAGDEEGLSEDAIREMDRDELVALVEENELEIEVKKFKKAADLAEAVIELMSASDAEPEEGGEEISEEMIREMDRDELIQLIKSESLNIDPKKFKKLPDLVEAVLAELYEEDPNEGTEDAGFDDTDFGDE